MTNAEKYVSFLKYPKDPKFAESIRHFQGAPSIAITKGGRIFMGWHTGGIYEPHIDNYNVLIFSDDDGETWKYKKLIDRREEISYPDIDFYNGKIYLTYDRERVGAKEILLLKFTEEDIMNPDYKFDIKIVSKP